MARLAADPAESRRLAKAMTPPGSTCDRFPLSRAAPSQNFGRIGSTPMRNAPGYEPEALLVPRCALTGTKDTE